MNLDVFLTKECNMKCVFCGAWVEQKCSELLPEELDIIFQEGKNYGFRYTTLSGGEPLLYKDFRKAVEIAIKHGFWVNVTTNGLLIDQDLIDFILHKNVNLRVSLHTLNREKHKIITGTDSGDIVVDHIQLLHRNQMYFSLGCTLYDDNAEEVEDMVDFAFQTGAAYIRFTPVVGVNKGIQYETDWNFYKDILSRIIRKVLKYRKYIAYEKSQIHHTEESNNNFISLMTTRRCPSGSNLFMIVDSEHNILPCQFIPQKESWYQPCNNICDITNSFSMLREKMKKTFNHLWNRNIKVNVKTVSIYKPV